MKDNRKQELVQNILNSNLSLQDKEELIQVLSKDGITWDDFMQHVITFAKLSKQALKLFDIDLGDD